MDYQEIMSKFPIGTTVCVTSENSDYGGLYGTVEAAYYDHSPKIVCSFFPPSYDSERASYETEAAKFEYGSFTSIPVMFQMLRKASRCRIYQINTQDSEFAFLPYDSLKRRGYAAPPAEEYGVAFDGQLKTDDPWDIFKLFSENPPEGCEALTTSDIVEIYDDEGSRFYYHDLGDFVEISFGAAADCCAA